MRVPGVSLSSSAGPGLTCDTSEVLLLAKPNHVALGKDEVKVTSCPPWAGNGIEVCRQCVSGMGLQCQRAAVTKPRRSAAKWALFGAHVSTCLGSGSVSII